MNISQLSYSKYCILVHNNREYFINYCPIKNCIEILLSNFEILQYFIFKYENKKWKYAKASIPSSACILFLILYSDATTTDTLGKSSLHPIYISLGNISTWRRNKEDTKQLLGYFSILFAKNEKKKTSPEFKKLVREIFHKSLKFLLDLLFENENGIDYKINNRIIWFFPKISIIIGNWPEACTYSLTYKSASSNFPCHFCLVQKNDLIDTMQDQIIFRNHENMMEHFNNNTGHSVSLEPVENYFWNILNLNIYAATVPDRMHHLDLGLYHYQIEFTKGILGRSSIDKMNERIGTIPRYPGLKIFSKGLQSIVRLTASEHRDLMKVMVFVVDDLLSDDLSEVYVKWNEMYILSRLEIFKESDLEKFQIFHIVDTIWEYEAINKYTTETYESLHKFYVKTPYRLSNKKDIEEQIMKTIRRKAIIKRRVMEELHKTPTALIYTSKLFEFKLLEASIFFEQQKKNPDLTENMIKGFAKFLECLDSFFDILDIISAEDCRIKIFAIAMDNAELFEYQSDNGTCYAQTLLITEVILPNKSPFHLALVQWYDFKSKKTPFVYDCPLLKLVEIYNFIEIEAIEEIVHIVPRFDTKDEYFSIIKDLLFENENGIDYKINNRIIWFFPKISIIIGNWPEACTYSLTYKSASSNFPCHFCLVQKNDLIDTMQDQIIFRNHENMMEHFNNNTGHSVSLEPVENYFWNILNLNIYAATVPDRMHHLDLGLYHYQIEFTKGILGRSSIDKMNERIGTIPRYPGLKIFSKGLQSIVRLTASEHRDLMKVMVFVVDDLLSDDLSEVYVKWNEMYILSRLEIFKESDLEKFQIFHIVDTIWEYEAINKYTTETYESLHKFYVKTPYRLSNKKDIEEQIMKTIRRKAIIKRRVMEELHKTPTALIYTSKLFEFKLLEASIFFEQQKKNPDLTENMIKGFAKFLECLDSFFDILDIISAEDCRIKIFAIAMDNAELFEYQSDNGTCYAQTLLITEVILPNKSPFHLALVQWYDFKSKKTPFVYDCPLLKLVEIYNFIEIEAIEEIVHIVPRFDTKDEYFVNKFIF
ncbi:hypothetical protein Glove_65g9 [Diversispora epigaea]|uniref:Uncharacterized protein n=1 Tax=Diversispora epigaea TaxID=1348612 RepID=A0A397JAZ7_9GLOM|nr:hypothetical protein Glove_65g9 [Diversispora epigaea]